MKINIIERKTIISNKNGIHKYFGWPTVTRLKDGRLAVAASGFRLSHICPFGKCVVSFSEDEGKTWSNPTVVIDTCLDDRDGGIAAFGESSVIVTSFNNTLDFQRASGSARHDEYSRSYLDKVEAERPEWRKQLGSTFAISHDNGRTFGDFKLIPISSPHGPIELPDGTLFYVGTRFSETNRHPAGEKLLACYKIEPDGSYELVSEIENVGEGYLSCEPYCFVTSTGKLIVHIRMEGKEDFSIFQSESLDGGKTFSFPRQLTPEKGGAPAHIIEKDGVLVSVYGYREVPKGIRAMFSFDDGETWETDQVLLDDYPDGDLGYPSSVILPDGNILTVYYAIEPEDPETCVISQVVWNFQK